MMISEYRITAQSPEDTPFGLRVAMRMISSTVWPFDRDDRISVLMTALSTELLPLLEDDDHIEAVLDQLRCQMKLAQWRRQL